MTESRKHKNFKEWLASNDPLIIAEGYLLDFERRGYLKAGPFIPEVVLEHPHLVKQLHEEFVHAGSDVVLSFTYFTNRKKLGMHGMKDSVETINKTALSLAKEIADKTGTILAGGVGHSSIYSTDAEAEAEMRVMYEEQIKWAKEMGVQYIIAESLGSVLEARLTIEYAKKFDLPIVVMFNAYRDSLTTAENINIVDACKMAEDLGADVVGINCGRGPATMIPILKELRSKCKGPLAALPACYRTSEKEPTWYHLTHPSTGELVYPKDLTAVALAPSDIEKFGKACQEIGIRYVGLCCGNCGSFTRALAESFGRSTPASRYSFTDTSFKSVWTQK